MRQFALFLFLAFSSFALPLFASNLEKAIKKGEFDTFKNIVDRGESLYEEVSGDPLIITAINHQRSQMVAYLIEKGIDVNKKYGKDLTAIIQASRKGCVPCVDRLLEAGADPDVQTSTGWTPILTAITHGHEEVAHKLLEHDIDVSVANFNNHSPLTVASKKGMTDIVRKLLEKGAFVNHGPIWDPSGEISRVNGRMWAGGHTALVAATSYGHFEIVKMLVEAGANIYQVNEKGRSPYEAAKKYDKDDILDYLVQVYENSENPRSKSDFKNGLKLTFHQTK